MINVTKTYLPDLERYKSYIDKIFSSGWLTNRGDLVQELEKRLQDYLGVNNLLVVSNGTLALQVAFKVLGLKGDVITSPFSFVATTSSLVWEGLTPIFSDIDPDSYTIDPLEIEKLITSSTSAILPVHVFGNSCNIHAIESLAKRYNLKTVYDAAHCFGVNYDGRGISNYGDAITFSFHSTKIFHTIEGGAIVFKDEEMLKKARLMINFGIPGPDNITELGINCKMNEFQAAMGLCILDEIKNIISKRERVWNNYYDAFQHCDQIKLQKLNKRGTNNFSYFSILLKSEKELLNIRDSLNTEEIYPRRYFYPSLETLPYLKKKQIAKISSDISKRILCLPLYDQLEATDQEKIISIIKSNLE